MNTLQIRFANDRRDFRPSEVLKGEANWTLASPAKVVEARLCWFTGGRAIPEASVVARNVFEHPKLSETRPFQFVLPKGPYSFRGNLTELGWAVELVAIPNQDSARSVFILSPNGQPIPLFETSAEAAA
jgi:hypothetical protein